MSDFEHDVELPDANENILHTIALERVNKEIKSLEEHIKFTQERVINLKKNDDDDLMVKLRTKVDSLETQANTPKLYIEGEYERAVFARYEVSQVNKGLEQVIKKVQGEIQKIEAIIKR